MAKRYSRKTRAIISGTGVGLASIYAIASHFDIRLSELNSFLLTTLLLLVSIMLLAAVTVAVFKALAWLLRDRSAADTQKAAAPDDESGPQHK